MNPQPQAPSRFRFLSFAPVTAALVALNVVLFAWEILHGVPLMNPSTWQVLDWGGNMPLLTLTGDWWRLLASMFLHIGFVHLGLNMYVLAFTGPRVEWEFGKTRMLAIYLIGGLLASCASAYWQFARSAANGQLAGPSAGASGAIMALFGALLAGTLLPPPGVPQAVARRGVDKGLIQVIVLNLGIGFFMQGVDQAAHVGGLIGGFAVGAIMAVAPRASGLAATLARYVVACALLAACLFGLLRGDHTYLMYRRIQFVQERQEITDAQKAAHGQGRAASGR